MQPLLVTALLLASLTSSLQERIEDNAWLRYKPGTWLKSKMTIETPGNTREELQTLTLAKVDGDEYVVEESYASPGSKTSKSMRSRGVIVGSETLTVAGKSYECKVNVVKGTNDEGPTESRFWNPVGSRNAIKIVFKQKGVEGEMIATSVDEKITALGRMLVCNRLEGKVKFGQVDGVITAVLCEDIPGAQVRADLILKGQDGETKIKCEAIEMLEKLKQY